MASQILRRQGPESRRSEWSLKQEARCILPTMQCDWGIEGEEMEGGQEQDAEVCVWSQETRSPKCSFVQTKTETDIPF